MKQPGEELQETLTELDGRAVVDYLIKNPESFVRNARVVEAIRVPHPVRGTVSLVGRYMARVRSCVHILEENMTLLMEQATVDRGLFHRLLYLQHSLTAANGLDDVLMRFHRWAHGLGLIDASLCLFPGRRRLGASSNRTHLALSRQPFEPLRIQRLRQEQRYPGPFNEPEFLVVLLEAKTVGSVAMSMLGNDVDLGVVLFTSRDTSHY